MAASITFVWHGLSCFSIEARNGDACANLVTDPYGAETGLKLPRNLSGDVVTVSHDQDAYNNIDAVKPSGEKKLFVIKTPGEYEVGGLFVYGLAAPEDDKGGKERGGRTSLYRFEVGDLSFAHLGDLNMDLLDAQRETLEDIDVLLIPVGGNSVLSAKKAVEIVTALEPRIVIPMHYAVPGLKMPSDPLDKFLKEMAGSPERMAKFKAVKKDLPVEETKVIVLELD